jgi:hypothetical protein
MAWTAPRTWVTAETVTAAILNTHVRDNTKELWRVIETVPHDGAQTPGQGGLYGLQNGTEIGRLSTRTYPGYPVEIRLRVGYVYETVTADGGFLIGLDDGTPGVTSAFLLAEMYAPSTGGGTYARHFTPSAGVHAYVITLWSRNGTGADSAAAGGGDITLFERGG